MINPCGPCVIISLFISRLALGHHHLLYSLLLSMKSHAMEATPSPSESSSKHARIISHWTKNTPEEGIQLIFNKADVLQAGSRGTQILTQPSSSDRPCQWTITLRLAHPSTVSASNGSLPCPDL